MHVSEEEHQRFLGALVASQKAQNVWVEHLRLKGFRAEIQPPIIRPNYDANFVANFVDGGDVLCWPKDGSVTPWKMEVKGRGLMFTSAADFSWWTLFVDRCAKVDDDEAEPTDYYVSLNSALTHAAVINAKTKARWSRRRVWDNEKGYWVLVYECPIELVKFVALEKGDAEDLGASGPAH